MLWGENYRQGPALPGRAQGRALLPLLTVSVECGFLCLGCFERPLLRQGVEGGFQALLICTLEVGRPSGMPRGLGLLPDWPPQGLGVVGSSPQPWEMVGAQPHTSCLDPKDHSGSLRVGGLCFPRSAMAPEQSPLGGLWVSSITLSRGTLERGHGGWEPWIPVPPTSELLRQAEQGGEMAQQPGFGATEMLDPGPQCPAWTWGVRVGVRLGGGLSGG